MPNVTVTFKECIQDSQDFASDDEHMVSRVRMAIAVDGKPQGSFNADLKQTVGSDYETGPIEVGPPIEDGTQRPYRGPFSQTEFAKEAAAYFRSLVGSQGGGIRLGSGSQNVRMRGNRFIVEKTVSFSAPSAPSGGW